MAPQTLYMRIVIKYVVKTTLMFFPQFVISPFSHLVPCHSQTHIKSHYVCLGMLRCLGGMQPLRLYFDIVDILISTRILADPPPHCFSHLFHFAPIAHILPCYRFKGHITCQVACTKGHVYMLHTLRPLVTYPKCV